MNIFKYVNLPIFLISWVCFGILGIILLPKMEQGSPGFYLCLIATIISFIFFAWQCLKGFFGMTADAKRGAELRAKDVHSKDSK